MKARIIDGTLANLRAIDARRENRELIAANAVMTTITALGRYQDLTIQIDQSITHAMSSSGPLKLLSDSVRLSDRAGSQRSNIYKDAPGTQDIVRKRFLRKLKETLKVTEWVDPTPRKNAADIGKFTERLAKASRKPLIEAPAFADIIRKLSRKTPKESTKASDALVKTAQKPLKEAPRATERIVKRARKVQAEPLQLPERLAKRLSRKIVDNARLVDRRYRLYPSYQFAMAPLNERISKRLSRRTSDTAKPSERIVASLENYLPASYIRGYVGDTRLLT